MAYKIDNKNILTEYGVSVINSDGLLTLPAAKYISQEFTDADGADYYVDEAPAVKSTTFELECIIKDNALTNFDNFVTALRAPGIRVLTADRVSKIIPFCAGSVGSLS